MAKVSLLLVLSLIGVSFNRQFCDSDSFDSVFNFGHLVYFLRCGEVWTWDPRMNNHRGGFLRDLSLYYLAQKYLWTEKDTTNDFRFSGFSFQEQNCFHHDEDLSDSCYNATKEWDHLTVLFTNHTALTFKYTYEYKEVDATNPLGFPKIHEFKNASHFWPRFREFSQNSEENFLSALYDPNLEVLFLGLKYNLATLITYTHMRTPLHSSKDFPLNNQVFYESWAQPYKFEGHLIGFFYDENKKQSYVVGEVKREVRDHNDQVYPLSLGPSNTPVIVNDPRYDASHNSENLRTYFGCKYTKEEEQQYFERRKKSGIRVKRCEPNDNLEKDIAFTQTADNVIDFLTKVSNNQKIMISLTVFVIILTSYVVYLFLNLNGKP